MIVNVFNHELFAVEKLPDMIFVVKLILKSVKQTETFGHNICNKAL